MAQPEFTEPYFIEGSTKEEIHERMMEELPEDIDDMPGGFPYDFTMPAAAEKDEFINYHLVRTIMLMFPQYAWDEWLDLHGLQVHLQRHEPDYGSGNVLVTGIAGAVIAEGTVFCTPATDDSPAIEFATDSEITIPESGEVTIGITAVEAGIESNVAANTIVIMASPDENITSVTNPEPITGGTETEIDDDYYDRIAAEYENSTTYLGNDTDYKRWAKQIGAGDCIVDAAWNGPGTVKLVLVDANGQPANEKLVKDVYNYIVSPDNRAARLLPTGSAVLTVVSATTVAISFTITGLQYDNSTDIDQIKEDFKEAVKKVYSEAKTDSILRYNHVRPVISSIAGVEDFETFLMNGSVENIVLGKEEYPETGTLDFS
ncbi:MAG: baseplate J/gp47 family protein [Lachnospiraceae bacterium]|nr:baseplate J/gp47 family protein [Lachnospiraceae bacterium]